MPTIGQRLKEAREYIGFSIPDVTQSARIYGVRIRRIEQGDIEPDPAELAILAKLYHRPMAWFQTGLDAPRGTPTAVDRIVETAGHLDPADLEELEKFAQFLKHWKATKPKETTP
jgi:transcriptional regulator with XRE-family HTH domain